MGVFGLVVYSRASFMLKLEELLGDWYSDFEALNSVEKTSCVWKLYLESLL